MNARTVYLSRLIGVFVLIVSLAAIVEKASFLSTFPAIIRDRPLVLVLGLITLAAGLAIVLAHNVWSGGVTPVVVTAFGWITAIRGAVLLFLPPDSVEALFNAAHVGALFFLYSGIALVIGLYLTYAGFRTAASAPITP